MEIKIQRINKDTNEIYCGGQLVSGDQIAGAIEWALMFGLDGETRFRVMDADGNDCTSQFPEVADANAEANMLFA